jgi:hypothetical protein
MNAQINSKWIDLTLFAAANIVNILTAAIFLLRVKGMESAEFIVGILVVAMAMPVVTAIIYNAAEKREWWTIVLPALLLAFLIAELLLDYIFKLEFRTTSLLLPYLLLFYLGTMGMIGYSFLIGRPFGYATLCTYFINLIAAWYSYSAAGHV